MALKHPTYAHGISDADLIKEALEFCNEELDGFDGPEYNDDAEVCCQRSNTFIRELITRHRKAPQDMNLRELFDHVDIVNDAIRAALLTHPGMTPIVTHEDAGTAHDPHAVGYERQGRR